MYAVGSGSIYALGSTTDSLVKFAGPGYADCTFGSICVLEFSFDVVNNSGAAVQLDFDFTIMSNAGDISWGVSEGKTIHAQGTTQPGNSGSGSALVDNGRVRFLFESSLPGGFTVDIPTNSIDFSVPTASGVPEPSTVALTLSGAAALALARRQRK